MESRNPQVPIFWNYVNSDEGMLEDSMRPRDRNWFRVTPWSQMEKFDWRWSNKNIDFRQYLVKDLKLLSTTGWWNDTSAYFKENHTTSDFSFVSSFTPASWDTNATNAEWWVNHTKVQRRWSASVKVQDWNVVFTKSGSFIIQYWCQFVFPSWYSTSNSYAYKLYVALKQKNSQWAWEEIAWTQDRACSTADMVCWTHVSWADEWDVINTFYSHTYNGNAVLCQPFMNVYKLS